MQIAIDLVRENCVNSHIRVLNVNFEFTSVLVGTRVEVPVPHRKNTRREFAPAARPSENSVNSHIRVIQLICEFTIQRLPRLGRSARYVRPRPSRCENCVNSHIRVSNVNCEFTGYRVGLWVCGSRVEVRYVYRYVPVPLYTRPFAMSPIVACRL